MLGAVVPWTNPFMFCSYSMNVDPVDFGSCLSGVTQIVVASSRESVHATWSVTEEGDCPGVAHVHGPSC